MLHWLSGGSVLGCFAYVNLAQNTKDKDAKMKYMFMHKSFGTLAAGLMLPRLALRLASKAPGPLTNAVWEQMLAKASHTAMYGFLIAMPATGVAMWLLLVQRAFPSSLQPCLVWTLPKGRR